MDSIARPPLPMSSRTLPMMMTDWQLAATLAVVPSSEAMARVGTVLIALPWMTRRLQSRKDIPPPATGASMVLLRIVHSLQNSTARQDRGPGIWFAYMIALLAMKTRAL